MATTVLSWGAQNIWAKAAKGSWTKLPDAVEESLELSTTKGDKLEANVEGGEPEAVKYKKNTWELAYHTRMATDDGAMRQKPFADDNGIISDEYSICIIPEDKTAPGLYIKRAHISLEQSYDATDGGQWRYTIEPMKNSDGTPMLVVGIVAVDATSGAPASITPAGALLGTESTEAITL